MRWLVYCLIGLGISSGCTGDMTDPMPLEEDKIPVLLRLAAEGGSPGDTCWTKYEGCRPMEPVEIEYWRDMIMGRFYNNPSNDDCLPAFLAITSWLNSALSPLNQGKDMAFVSGADTVSGYAGFTHAIPAPEDTTYLSVGVKYSGLEGDGGAGTGEHEGVHLWNWALPEPRAYAARSDCIDTSKPPPPPPPCDLEGC